MWWYPDLHGAVSGLTCAVAERATACAACADAGAAANITAIPAEATTAASALNLTILYPFYLGELPFSWRQLPSLRAESPAWPRCRDDEEPAGRAYEVVHRGLSHILQGNRAVCPGGPKVTSQSGQSMRPVSTSWAPLCCWASESSISRTRRRSVTPPVSRISTISGSYPGQGSAPFLPAPMHLSVGVRESPPSTGPSVRTHDGQGSPGR
jgi:hypothetical protein